MEYIKIGVIANTHGLKGELKIKSFTDFDRFNKGNTVYIKCNNKYTQMTIKSHRVHNGLDMIVFDGLEDINKVELYKGSELYIHIDDRDELEEDEFYYDELVGLLVYYNDELLGKVSSIMDVPQGEILVVERENMKDILIPFENKFIPYIDDEKIICENLEGLL